MGFSVTSDDFADGGPLPAWASNSYWSGQCTGDNISPHLAWSDAPEGTESFAIVITDSSGNDWVHFLKANIPADVNEVARGEIDALEGVAGRNQGDSRPGYFGPCPPSGDHYYEHRIWALDTTLDLTEGYAYYDLWGAAQGHILEEVKITGVFTGRG